MPFAPYHGNDDFAKKISQSQFYPVVEDWRQTPKAISMMVFVVGFYCTLNEIILYTARNHFQSNCAGENHFFETVFVQGRLSFVQPRNIRTSSDKKRHVRFCNTPGGRKTAGSIVIIFL